MAENKTKATTASVEDYLASRASAQQLADSRALMAMFARLTKDKPKMWGPSIVGYGSYRYTYHSGRSGEMPLAAFAIRGRELVVYLDCEDTPKPLLATLGKHKMSKSCLYIRQLADVDAEVLEQLVADSMARARQRCG